MHGFEPYIAQSHLQQNLCAYVHLFHTGFTSALLALLHRIVYVIGLIPGMEMGCTDSFLILSSP